MSKRTTISFIVVVLVGLLVAGLWLISPRLWRGNSTDTRQVRIATFQTAIDYAPYVIARRKGWIDEALKGIGIKPEYLPTIQSLPSVNELIAVDRLDIVLSGEVPTLIGRSAGIDVQIAWLSCRLSADTIIHLSSTAKSIADLKGKRVAVLAGSGPYYWFVRNLEQNGLSKQDVTFLDMPPPDAKAAFETGTVDAWAMFPPWPEQELVTGSAKVLPGFKAPIQVVVAVRGRFAKEQPATLVAFLSALDRAKEWLRQNPEEAQILVSQELNLPLDVVKLSWTKLDWSTQFDSNQTQDIADFLKAEGFVKNAVDVRDLILPGVNEP